MNNVSFSDPEYTNKVPSLISEASQLSAIPTITGAPGGQLGLFLRLHPAVLRSECTHWAGTYSQLVFLFSIAQINQKSMKCFCSTRTGPLRFWAFLAISSYDRLNSFNATRNDHIFIWMQEPGANASEIYSVLRHVRPGDDFVPNFEMFAKSDVNGKDQNPIYEFLKSRCPSVRAEFQASYKLYYEPYHQDDIRWGDTYQAIKKYFKFKTLSKGGILKSSWWTTRVNQCVAMTNHLILLSL